MIPAAKELTRRDLLRMIPTGLCGLALLGALPLNSAFAESPKQATPAGSPSPMTSHTFFRNALPTCLVACATVLPGAPEPDAPSALPQPFRLYFVGNSVTDTVRYGAFAALAKGCGVEVVWGRHMIPGAPLEWLHDHPDDGFREKPFGGWKQALGDHPWDAVSLQPFDRHLHRRNVTGEDVGDVGLIVKMARMAAVKNPEVQVYVYARWPRVTQGGKSIPFDKNAYDPSKPGSGHDLTTIDDYLARWNATYTGGWDGTNETRDYFETLLREVRLATPELRKPVRLVPVGHVLADLHRQMKAGGIAGWTDVRQFYKDGIHLNEPGSYAVGCTFFATLFGQSPVGLPTEPYGTVPAELAKAIQETALRVVRSHPDACGSANPAQP